MNSFFLAVTLFICIARRIYHIHRHNPSPVRPR